MEVTPFTFKATVNGKTNERTFKFKGVEMVQEGNEILVKLLVDRRDARAKGFTVAAHLRNMIKGVAEGFEAKLAAVHSHFPMNLTVKGDVVEIVNFLGEKKPRKSRIMPGCQVQAKGKDVIIKGHDKEAVGQTAGNLEKASRMTKKDRRRFQDGIYIVQKPR